VDVLLGVEHDRREDDDRHRQREQQEPELAGARLERVAQDAQTLHIPNIKSDNTLLKVDKPQPRKQAAGKHERPYNINQAIKQSL